MNQRKRFGCDHCKKDKGTFYFKHSNGVQKHMIIWICQTCLEILMQWTPQQRVKAKQGC